MRGDHRQLSLLETVDPYLGIQKSNKKQTNFAKGGIILTSPTNFSFVFARWPHAICNCMFWLGVRPQISPSLGVRDRHL